MKSGAEADLSVGVGSAPGGNRRIRNGSRGPSVGQDVQAGGRSRPGQVAAAWILGAVLSVLALSHVPAAGAGAGTAGGAASGTELVGVPAAKRLLPAGTAKAELAPSAAVVLPPTLLLTLLVGVAALAVRARTRRVRSGVAPRRGRGPPTGHH